MLRPLVPTHEPKVAPSPSFPIVLAVTHVAVYVRHATFPPSTKTQALTTVSLLVVITPLVIENRQIALI